MFLGLIAILLLKEICAKNNLQLAYQWKMIRIASPYSKTNLDTKQYIPEHHLPFALDVYKDRMFIVVPRLKPSIAASLAYIKLSEADNAQPRFHPYPSRQFHNILSKSPTTIVSAISLRVDRCDRLWVLDQGTFNAGTAGFQILSNPQVFIFDLKNDMLLNIYTIPTTQLSGNSSFANLVVEDHDCDNSFAYLADIDRPAMVVYSYRENRSWVVRHPYFHKRPEPGHITFRGNNYPDWQLGLFGMALSRPDLERYSTMYFHPIWTDEEFTVTTKFLRNEALVNDENARSVAFEKLGSRGPKGESGSMCLDQNLDVLFFASIHRNEVNCWRTTKTYSEKLHGTVISDSSLFPNDVKIDANGTLWVLSNNLPTFLYSSHMDTGLYNYEVYKGRVIDVIKDTPCDSDIAMLKRSKTHGPSQDRLKGRINSSAQGLCRDILSIVIFVTVMILR